VLALYAIFIDHYFSDLFSLISLNIVEVLDLTSKKILIGVFFSGQQGAEVCHTRVKHE
jgi:hypothetical protein